MKREDLTSCQPREGMGAKWNWAEADTITEKYKAIAAMQRLAEMLSDLQDILDLNKAYTGPELREPSAHSQYGINGVTVKESHLRSNKELCFGRNDSNCIGGSHWHSNHKCVGSSSRMTTVKQTRTRQTSSNERSNDQNELRKTKDELMGKQEKMATLEDPNQKLKGKCAMKQWESGQFNCSDKSSNYEKPRNEIFIVSHLRTQMWQM